MKKGGSWVRAQEFEDGVEHADLRVDVSGNAQFASVGTPSFSTTSAVTTASTTTTTPGLVLATQVLQGTLNITGTATTLTLNVNLNGSAVATATTGSATTLSLTATTPATSQMTTLLSPTWTISATIGTARQINTLSATINQGSRW